MTTTASPPTERTTPNAPFNLRVTQAHEPAPGIRTLRLSDPHGATLPSYPPGSHVVVHCGERPNAYSLTGPGTEPDHYSISVLLRPDGDGGSRWLHEHAHVGSLIRVSPPRSAFPPIPAARHHLLIAGGIGITPLLAHARAARAWGRSFTLLYGHRPGAAAHLDELSTLCGPALERFGDRGALRDRITTALTEQPLGTHLYVCGPSGLTDFVLDRARAAGWPEARVHSERFEAASLDPGRPFTVRLASSGRRVAVPSGTSLLAALEGAGTPVPSLCRQGVCGQCRVGVLAGRPEHRDHYLSEEERAACDSIMACVSRGADDELELEL
ncbi:PDR/VanB family oxidoreductase [Streptomyces phaeochromogenes]|uniref:PDR/VanB family oxidoreductase n=1 Tax=Streptomyces phaeochromogenes TaxID=1923 RepID=UPI002DDA87A6|nr:PDR/VanB family oxidoreductase [Streptomyces phaeochromogenes]WRZ34634.1 PDR/VanB family oxidoreductase [Streptomyces phaeochromogenes]